MCAVAFKPVFYDSFYAKKVGPIKTERTRGKRTKNSFETKAVCEQQRPCLLSELKSEILASSPSLRDYVQSGCCSRNFTFNVAKLSRPLWRLENNGDPKLV